MRETPGSLRAWFLASGIAGMFGGLVLAQAGNDQRGLEIVLQAIGFFGLVVLGMVHVIAALRLRDDLPRGAGWIQHLLLGTFVLLFGELLLAARAHPDLSSVGTLVIIAFGMLLTTYLRTNVSRLALELARPAAPSARAL